MVEDKATICSHYDEENGCSFLHTGPKDLLNISMGKEKYDIGEMPNSKPKPITKKGSTHLLLSIRTTLMKNSMLVRLIFPL